MPDIQVKQLIARAKLRLPPPLPLGLTRPPIANFLTGYLFTAALEISVKERTLK
jgi:hypothetical protein